MKELYGLCDYHSSYNELREKAGMSTMYVGRLRTAMCEVFKVVNDIGPVYLKQYFTLKDSSYETRTAMPLVVLKFNSLKFGKGSFSYEGVFLWNYLGNTLS